MAASMKEGIDDYNDEKDKDEEEEKEEKKEEAEKEHAPEDENQEEYKSEESEEETESETEGESDGALDEDKRTKLEPQIIKYENRLSAFKKGNVLLQANVDNLQDEISKVREKARSLQAELDAVLADLGM